MKVKRVVLRVSEETAAKVKAHADKRGVLIIEAAEALLATGFGRLDALHTYAAKQAQKRADRKAKATS